MKILNACLIIFVFVQVATAQSLYTIPDNIETRWASPENPKAEKGKAAQTNGGRKGSPFIQLKPGEQAILAEVSGTSGTVRRIWMTIMLRSPEMLRGLKLEFFWDGAKTPAVSAPLGDFFGMGLGQMSNFQSALFSSPEGKSFNCYIPMPFKTGMKMVVSNETDTDLMFLFYDVDYTVGDKHGEDVLYFHAYFRRENPTKMKQDFELLPKVIGKGRFLGVNAGVIVNQERYFKTWWGEGEVKVYLDGDSTFPTLSGTGTEDYIGTGWELGEYANPYQGCLVADHENMQFSFYRYHIPDPIYFYDDIRVTIQQIGFISPNNIEALKNSGAPIYKAGPDLTEIDKAEMAPFVLFEREDDWSSCAYFYLDKPENGLPPIVSFEKRVENLTIK